MKTKKLDSYTRTMGDFEVIEPNDEAEFHSEKTELEGKQEYNFQFELENEFFDGQSEEYVDGDGENDVYVELAQKEKDLLLAAELGKALLEKNEELSKKYERLQEDYSQQAEELEQEKHELRLKLERIGGSHESRVHELQTDIQSLRNELRSLKTASLTDSAHKRKSFAELTEENEKLHSELYQLQNSHEALSGELNTIKRQQLSRSFSIDDIHNRQIELQELCEKVARLEEGRNYLTKNVEELVSTRDGLTKDIEELQGKNQELQKKYDDVKRQFEDTDAKLDESKNDNLYLQDQLDEWKIQASLDQTSRGSLFSELSDMSISLDNIDGLSPKVARRDQQTKESGHHLRPVQSLHGTPRPLAASSSLCLGSLSSNKRPRQYSSVDSDEEDSDDSDLEYDESEVDVEVDGIVTRNVDFYAQLEHEQKTNAQLKREIIDAHNELRASYERLRRCREGPTIKIEPLDPSEEFESGSLTSFVQLFKDVLDDIVKTQQKIALTRKNSGYAGSMVGSISDNLKEQIRQLKEDLYEAYKEMEHLREEAVTTKSRMKQKECDFTALNGKLEDRADQIKHLKEERKRLVLKECDPNLAFDIVYQQAIEDKEEALRREGEIALELEKTKRDAARLDKQLMEAIQQKIELSEQLEEWQFDMASLIEEQVQKQMRKATSEQEEARSRKAGLFSKGWNWSSNPKRQNVL